MNEPLTAYQVRRKGKTLGVFSTYWAADTYAKDKSLDVPRGNFVVGHVTATGDPTTQRFVPSGFWKNGVWEGNES